MSNEANQAEAKEVLATPQQAGGMSLDIGAIQTALGEKELTIIFLKSELSRLHREVAQARAEIKRLSEIDTQPRGETK